jgi:cell division protein FtsA
MGLIELAEEISHMPVRMGGPQNVTGLTEVVRNPGSPTGVWIVNVWKRPSELGQGMDSDG